MAGGSFTVAALALVGFAGAAEWKLHQKTVGTEFFSPETWSFFTDPDPTNGVVQYVNFSTALDLDMIQANPGEIYIGLSNKSLSTVDPGDPIPSVRLESLEKFNSGLFILSMNHQPTGCGVWPAFWMTGDDPNHPWPSWGEADWLEGAHGQEEVWTTLHTWANCDQSAVKPGKDFSGYWQQGYMGDSTNCSVIDGKQKPNEGCPVVGPQKSMGPAFNNGGGGTFAFEWDPDAMHLRAFYFPLGQEPADLVSGNPIPDAWGMPYAKFNLDAVKCPKDRFKEMKIVLNTDFCGMWGDYDNTFHAACPHLANYTCAEYVSTFTSDLSESYWSITRLDIYQKETNGTNLGLILGLTVLGSLVILAVVLLVARQMRSRSREPLLADAAPA